MEMCVIIRDNVNELVVELIVDFELEDCVLINEIGE